MREILEEFSGEEKLYKKVLEFSNKHNKGIDENIILRSYFNNFSDLQELFNINLASKDEVGKIKNMKIFRDAFKYRLNSVAESIYCLIKNIYPSDSTDLRFSSRFKSYESIFMKRLFSKNVENINDIHDFFGIRFTVPDSHPELCYKIFEIINTLYVIYSSRYKDFIPMPNERGYQTLQWTSIVPGLDKIEFQIRTKNMALINDAEHDSYKDKYLEEKNLNEDYLTLIIKNDT